MSGPEYEYDAEFEAYLRRRVRLDRRFRAFDRLEPPAELDRIIIRQAREAIQVPANAPAFRTPKWAAPMALAATLLVSFSLLLDVGLRQAVQHDALSAPMVVEMEFQQGQGPAAEQAEHGRHQRDRDQHGDGDGQRGGDAHLRQEGNAGH